MNWKLSVSSNDLAGSPAPESPDAEELLPASYLHVGSSEGTLAPYEGAPDDATALVERAVARNYFDYVGIEPDQLA